MDYKKKYEDALPYIKDLIEHNVISIKNAEKYFPELIDSDEKVRKAIVELVLQSSEILGSNNQSRMLAWLEKQGGLKELSQSKVTKISDQDDVDALEQAMYALESFIVEDKPNKCFAGHHVPFIKAIEKLKSLKQRLNK